MPQHYKFIERKGYFMRILLVEHDEKLKLTLSFQLKKEHFVTDTCSDGEEAIYYIRLGIYDLILLDRMIPLLSGDKVLEIMRSENIVTPVIILTALGDVEDKITGLDLGADDYLVKPFDFEELMARIRCIFRRPRKLESFDILNLGNTSYYIHENKLSCGSKNCSLSKREGALMEIFFKNASQVLPRELLLSKVWGIESDVEMGNLDNYIHFLRRRLKTVDSSLSIQTIRGIGFSMEERGKGGKDS